MALENESRGGRSVPIGFVLEIRTEGVGFVLANERNEIGFVLEIQSGARLGSSWRFDREEIGFVLEIRS